VPASRYPAIGDIVEIRFAEADVPLGNDELAHGHFQGAIRYYGRARTLVERYLDEGGSMNAMRQMMEGGRPDPEYDTNLQVLYDDAMKGLELSYRSTGQTDLAARMATEMATGDTSFQSIITQARKATGE